MPIESAPRRARLATMLLFFLSGATYATWGIHIPTLQRQFSLSEGWLSLAMFAVAGGAIVAMPTLGRWIQRSGSHRAALYGAIGLGLTLALILLVPTFPFLLGILLLFGVTNAAFDVAMNAQAVTVETALGKPIMSSLHGMFSLGGMLGASFGAALLAAGLSALEHVLLLAALVMVSGVAAFFYLLPDHAASHEQEADTHVSASRLVRMLGWLALLGLIAEGAMYDWSVIYARDTAQMDAASSSLAYAAFSGGMAAGRFGGDWLRARHGGVTLLRGSAALSLSGLLLALIWPGTALIGFTLVGLGAANLIPVLFVAAARIPGVAPAVGIAKVARLAYIGLLLGPVLIGSLAQASSLRWALVLVALNIALIGCLAQRALREIPPA